LSRTVLLAAALLACGAALATRAHAQRGPDARRPQARPGPARRDTARAPLRLCAGGDVTLGTNLDTAWVWTASDRAGYRVAAFPDPDSILAPVRRLVRDADVVLLNVEGAIGTGPSIRKCGPASTRCFAFRQPIGTAAALQRVGSDSAEVIGNVANNHAGDAGPSGIRQTLRHLANAGVHATGADTLATPVVTARGDTVAFLGFSQWNGPDPRDLAAVRRHVRRAAARWPRLVVTMHMGAEGGRAQRTPDRDEMFLGANRGNEVAFAHAAVDAGADLVIGHGPHVMRAAEQRGDALILYSLGNLATYGPFSLSEPLNRAAVACFSLAPDGHVVEGRLKATKQRVPGIPSRDPSGRALALVDSLGRLDFPRTYIPVSADGQLLFVLREEVGLASPARRRTPRPRASGAAPRS
jgi:hypothetical protein